MKKRRVRCVACLRLMPREQTRPARDPGKRCCINFVPCFEKFHTDAQAARREISAEEAKS